MAPLPSPTYTISQAANLTGLHRDTIKRRLRAGDFPRATQDAAGTWRIPRADLTGAGLTVGERPEPQGARGALAADLATARGEADKWRAVAEERAATIDSLRLALRALEAPRPAPEGLPETSPQGAPGRPWWRPWGGTRHGRTLAT